MLDASWLFDPFFKVENCIGPTKEEVTCYVEPFGITPIIVVIVGTFIGYLWFASFINKRKLRKQGEKDDKKDY